MENIGLALRGIKGLLHVNRSALRITVRYSNRINVRKPRPPHYERQKIEAFVKPRYFEKGERESWFLPRAYQCLKEEEDALKKQKKLEDNPYERLLAKDLKNWFLNSKLIAFFHANPIKFDDKFEVEVRLRKENMYLKTLGKHTVNMALEGTPYISVLQLFNSRTEMVFCSEPKVDKLLKIASKMRNHVLLAAVVEDRLMSVSQLKTLNQVKDITTARAQLVGVLNTVQSQLLAGLTYHQSNLVAGLQHYADSGAEGSKQADTANVTPESEETQPLTEPEKPT